MEDGLARAGQCWLAFCRVFTRHPWLKWALAAVVALWTALIVVGVSQHPPLALVHTPLCSAKVFVSIASIPGREERAEAVVAWLLSHPLASLLSGVHLFIPRVLMRKNITTDTVASGRICARFPHSCHLHFVDDVGSISKLHFPQLAAPPSENILYLDDDRIHDDRKLTFLLTHGCHYDALGLSGYLNSFNFVKDLLSHLPFTFLWPVDVVRGTGMVYTTKRVPLPLPPPSSPCFLMDDEVISGAFARAGYVLAVDTSLGGGGGVGDFPDDHGKYALAYALDRSPYYAQCQLPLP